ncbi:MAG: hypothetical protein HFI63_00695 [Lachnospiraceae bacterium]|nr:hypothetical protein [Lachnospiraceae bacterium]
MGQETIRILHQWSERFLAIGIGGAVLLAVLFRKFGYGAWCMEQIKRRKRKGRKRKRRGKEKTAFLLATAFLILPMIALIKAVFLLPQSVKAQKEETVESAEKVFVTMEGESVRPSVYRDTAVAEFTFVEKNFDSSGISVTVGDETGRETRITFEEGEARGLEGLGEGKLELIPYKIPEAGGENSGDKEETPEGTGSTEGAPVSTGEVWFLDSEEGWSEHTEDRTVRMRLQFPMEGRFEIREVLCRDLAGNVSGLSAPVFVTIDRTPPKLEILLPEEELAHEGYYNHPITVWLYLQEHNFQSEETETLPQITLKTEKQGEGENNIRSEKEEEEKSEGKNGGTEDVKGSWELAPEKGEDWYKFPVNVVEEGSYFLEVSYQDGAGWPLSPESVTELPFTVDMTAPETGIIRAMGESWSALIEQITFGHYSSKEELVVLEGGDSVSPVEPLQFFCSQERMTEEELTALPEECWKEGNSLFLSPDVKTIVYLKVTNYAGLERYFSSDGLVIENKGPIIALSPRGDAWTESGIYRGDVELTVSLTEPEETGVVSGLKSASYRLESEQNGKRELLKEEILLEEGVSVGAEGDLTIRKDWKNTILLSSEDYDGKLLWFTVLASDMAGNQSEKSMCFSMDKTAPKIQITYGEGRPENGRYYNQERTAYLAIEEVNFSEEQVWLLITNTDGVMPKISEWSHEGSVHRCQVIFFGDGDYTFSVRCKDRAGHVSEKKEEDFTIDRTLPKIFVTFQEGEQTGDNRYYAGPRTAEITVEEHNFKAEDLTGELHVLLDNGKEQSWFPEEFDSRGDIHRAELVFSEDGDYRVWLEYLDLAGNRTEKGFEDVFSIDQTPPLIQISGIKNASANRGEVRAEALFRDKRLVPGSATLEILRMDGGGEKEDYQYREYKESEGRVIKELLAENFPKTEEKDGLYLLRASGRDLAGNRAEEELIFSVNRYGSVYAATGETAEWMGAGAYPYLSKEREVIVREYNVDPVEESQLAVSRNGEISRLAKEKDFQRIKVSEDSPISKWQVYEYKIQKEVFEKEGDYEILFYSRDKAGNQMGNSSVKNEERAVKFAFSVDKTGPSAILSGAEDGGRYKTDQLKLFLDIRDNMHLRKVEVKTEEETYGYEGAELEKISTEKGLEVILSESDDWQTLTLYAEDGAGNRLKLGNGHGVGVSGFLEWNFLVTSDWWIQLYRNPVRLVFFLLLVGVILATGVILTVRWRKKWGKHLKKKNQKVANHSQTKDFMLK